MLPKSEGKSSFWKFRHILYRLEKHFLKTDSREILSTIEHYYILMKDYNHAESLLAAFDSSYEIGKIKVLIAFADFQSDTELGDLLKYR